MTETEAWEAYEAAQLALDKARADLVAAQLASARHELHDALSICRCRPDIGEYDAECQVADARARVQRLEAAR